MPRASQFWIKRPACIDRLPTIVEEVKVEGGIRFQITIWMMCFPWKMRNLPIWATLTPWRCKKCKGSISKKTKTFRCSQRLRGRTSLKKLRCEIGLGLTNIVSTRNRRKSRIFLVDKLRPRLSNRREFFRRAVLSTETRTVSLKTWLKIQSSHLLFQKASSTPIIRNLGPKTWKKVW